MIRLRQAKEEDYKFLYELKRKTLKEYIAKTWSWDDEWQEMYFSKNFHPNLINIIVKIINIYFYRNLQHTLLNNYFHEQ